MQTMNTTTENLNRNRKTLMSADGVFLLANVIGAIALGVGVMCAAAITISGKIRDDALKVELEASKITAEELRTANLKLEAEIAPRRLKSEQQDAVAKALESFAEKSVYFGSYNLDLEASALGEQLSDALAKANIKGDVSGLRKRIPTGMIADGILISGKDGKLVNALIDALAPTGLKVSRGEAVEAVGGVTTQVGVGLSVPKGMSPAMAAMIAAGQL